MAAPALSVVIPTHKRPDLLKECLDRLQKQTLREHLEVIVVSDGHDAQTQLAVEEGKWDVPVAFFEVEKSQQGVARNRGVQEARGEIVLFIGDDIYLAPDACALHLGAHKKHRRDIAILGFTTWDTALDITPAMRWLEESGWQFGYNLLTPYAHDFVPAEMQHRFTYTSHISVPRAVAQAHPFLTDVSMYGWEDIVWGQALQKAGIPLFYEPDAQALHHHRVTLDDSLARIETLGRSLLHITRVAPDLDRRPTGLKLWAYRLIALTPTMRGRHYRAFLRGLEGKH